MSDPAEALQRFGLKLFLETAEGFDPHAVIPVFHRWIQHSVVEGLLIDVADYTHLPDGPRVLLVGHEGNYALDYGERRPGLRYARKQPINGPLSHRLSISAQMLLRAAQQLETEPALESQCQFRTDELEFVANDRLLAPAASKTALALQPALATLGAALDPTNPWTLAEPQGDQQKGRLTLSLRSPKPTSLSSILDNLSASQ